MRAHPERVTYGPGSVGTSSHFAPELLAARTGAKLVHDRTAAAHRPCRAYWPATFAHWR
jgi:tripartite-type tricarboxylate transporter receptor subunit TctC